MLDLLLIRADKGGNPQAVIDNQKKRYKSTEIVQESIDLVQKWKDIRQKADTALMNYNNVQKEIQKKKKESKGKDPCTELLKDKEKKQKEAYELNKQADELLITVKKKYSQVGNMLHESVPIDNNEDNNEVVKTWGTPDKKRVIDDTPGNAHHYKVLQWIGGYDSERGVKIAGHRGYFLTGWGVALNQALIHYGIKFLNSKGYTPIQPPYFMKREIMGETAELADFDDMLYKVEGSGESGEGDYYLIATAEQPISTMYRGEWLERNKLPLKYGGISPCFRKEAGAHGKDTWGIFRIHQFEKVEQFVICAPEESWKYHEEMIKVSEEFYQSLNLPYRVINIVSGALNNAAAKKYDLEAWFPGYGTYRELVSCSNCTDYQSRSAEIRLRTDKKVEGDKKIYVHMLNGTLCATERALCCILENYQTEKGLNVPEVLRPYVGVDFIPYIEELLPKELKAGDKNKKKGKESDKKDKGKKDDKEKKEKKDKKDKKEKKEDKEDKKVDSDKKEKKDQKDQKKLIYVVPVVVAIIAIILYFCGLNRIALKK
jgi:seryl-tRNA synthetase